MPSTTNSLNLYKPDAGETGVADELNQNWSTIDVQFDRSAGHLHNGQVGQGPKLPVTSIAASGVPSSSTYLRGDGSWQAGTGGGGAVAWDDITGKPATYPSDWDTTIDKPATFPPETHQHAAADTTSGIFTTGRLASGTPSINTFVRGDGAWAGIDYSQIVNKPGTQFAPAYSVVWDNYNPGGDINALWDPRANGVPAAAQWVWLSVSGQATLGAQASALVFTAELAAYPYNNLQLTPYTAGERHSEQGIIYIFDGSRVKIASHGMTGLYLTILACGLG